MAGIARQTSVQSEAMTSFFRPVFFTASTTRFLPSVDEAAIDRPLIWKDVLNVLDQQPAAFFQNRGQDGRYPEQFGGLGEPDDIVDDQCRLMTVQIGELERLMIDQQQHAVLPFTATCYSRRTRNTRSG